MTTYNPHDKRKLRSPDTQIQIGVTIITRATQEFDMGVTKITYNPLFAGVVGYNINILH